MPYKIVQTIEKGRPVLTAVPDGWEISGTLFWPKKHEKLRRIEHSKPETNWRPINCILKRSNLSSFSQAEQEIDSMSNASDTETDNDNVSHTRNHNKKNISKFQQAFNDMARQCCDESQPQLVNQLLKPRKENMMFMNSAPLQCTITSNETTFPTSQNHTNPAPLQYTITSNETTMPTSQNHTNPAPLQYAITSNDTSMPTSLNTVTKNLNQETPILISEYQNIDNMYSEEPTGIRDLNSTGPIYMADNTIAPTSPDRIVADVIGIDDAMSLILQKLDSLKEDINKLSENQKKIMFKLTETNTQFEEFIKTNNNQTTRHNESTPVIKPVCNLKELQNLENMLADPDFKARIKNKIDLLCSKGKGRGTNNAYNLIDVFFQRNFLCQCSWAGGSKSGSSKICLKSFTNVFDLFLSTINESDPCFKKPDCEKFIKTVLKNSRQRLESKQIRLSTTRCRQKVKTITKSVVNETSKGPTSTSVRENHDMDIVTNNPEMLAGPSVRQNSNGALVTENPEMLASTSVRENGSIAIVTDEPEMLAGTSVRASRKIVVATETTKVPAGTSVRENGNIATVNDKPEMLAGASVCETSNQDEESLTDYLL
ncbi:hypothetical protein evm_013644 [Chilo suppressalis]|nr:hypothetical protein evm_013644 [Chilo suppressalis]